MARPATRWLLELRQAARSLCRAPGFTAIAVLALGLGLAVATAIFTLLKAVVLDPLGYPDADRLMLLRTAVPGSGTDSEWQISYPQFLHLKGSARTLSSIDLYAAVAANVATPVGTERASVAVATPGTLDLIGARVAAGRLFGAADDMPDAANVVLLSHRYWQTRFGGSADAVGRAIRIDGLFADPGARQDLLYEVVGVLESNPALPGGLRGSDVERPDLWLPLRADLARMGAGHSLPALALRAPDATLAAAQAELDVLTPGLIEAFPDFYSQASIARLRMRTMAYDLKTFMVGSLAQNLWLAQAAAALLLAIAWADLANLFLVRTESLRREVAMRNALGASRGAVFRYFAAQSVLLALGAAAVGIVCGHWLLQWIAAYSPIPLPRAAAPAIDAGVCAFVFALAMVAALLLALYPALRTGGLEGLAEAGRGATAGRERHRVRAALVTGQVALALVLVVAAGLFLDSFRELRNADDGIDPSGVVAIGAFHDQPTMSNWWPFMKEALDRVRALPGVAAAGAGTAVPLGRFGGHGCTSQGFADAAVYERVESAGMTTCAAQAVVTPGYFKALGIPLLRGRGLQAEDLDAGAATVVVSRAFAARFWPGEDAIGKRIAPYGRKDGPWHRVVGVASDVFAASVQDPPAVVVYYPLAPQPGIDWYFGGMTLLARTSLAQPTAIVPDIRKRVEALDATVVFGSAEAVSTMVRRSMGRTSFTLFLVGGAAAMALALAMLGLYGVVAYLVAERRGEIGIRMALGALPARVRRMVVIDYLRVVAAGVAIGVAASLALSGALRGFLYGVSAIAPLVYLVAIALLIGAAMAAAWLAARRAVRITPMDALRAE